METVQSDTYTTRKRFSRRTFAAMTAGFVLAGTGIRAASAGRSWCRVDPVVMIDGQLADVFVASDLKMLLTSTGPIKMTISIPEGSQGWVVLTDLGFAKGYDIDFVETSSLQRHGRRTPVTVDVYAPAKDGSLPVTVTFAPRTLGSSLGDILFGMSADGHANEWVTLVP
ncbi:MAG TPA: hypothetical protein VH482_08435 [Thermomicrobiales bacterium]|jgi:hypothetical protein